MHAEDEGACRCCCCGSCGSHEYAAYTGPPLQYAARLLHAAAVLPDVHDTTSTTAAAAAPQCSGGNSDSDKNKTTTLLHTALLQYAEHVCTSHVEWAAIQQCCRRLAQSSSSLLLSPSRVQSVTAAVQTRAAAVVRRAQEAAAAQRRQSDALLHTMRTAAAAHRATGGKTSGVSRALHALLSTLQSSSLSSDVTRDVTTMSLLWVLDNNNNNTDSIDEKDAEEEATEDDDVVGTLDAATVAQMYSGAYVMRTLRASATLVRSAVTCMRATAATSCVVGVGGDGGRHSHSDNRSNTVDALHTALQEGMQYVAGAYGSASGVEHDDIRIVMAQLELLRCYVVLLCAHASAATLASGVTQLPVTALLTKAASYVTQLQMILYGDDDDNNNNMSSAAAAAAVEAAEAETTTAATAAVLLRRQWAHSAAIAHHHRVCVALLEEYAVFFHTTLSLCEALSQRFDGLAAFAATSTPPLYERHNNNNNNSNNERAMTAPLSAVAAAAAMYGVVRYPALQRVLLAREHSTTAASSSSSSSRAYVLLASPVTSCASLQLLRPLPATLYNATTSSFFTPLHCRAARAAASTTATTTASAEVPVMYVTRTERKVLPTSMCGSVLYLSALVSRVLMPCDAFATLLLLCATATLPWQRVVDEVVSLSEVQAMLQSSSSLSSCEMTTATAVAARRLCSALTRGALGEAWLCAQAVCGGQQQQQHQEEEQQPTRRHRCCSCLDVLVSSSLLAQLLTRVQTALCYAYLRVCATVSFARATRELCLSHSSSNNNDDDNNSDDDGVVHTLMQTAMQFIRAGVLRGRVDCVHHVYTNVDARALLLPLREYNTAATRAATTTTNTNTQSVTATEYVGGRTMAKQEAAVAALARVVLQQTDEHMTQLQQALRAHSLSDQYTLPPTATAAATAAAVEGADMPADAAMVTTTRPDALHVPASRDKAPRDARARDRERHRHAALSSPYIFALPPPPPPSSSSSSLRRAAHNSSNTVVFGDDRNDAFALSHSRGGRHHGTPSDERDAVRRTTSRADDVDDDEDDRRRAHRLAGRRRV